jgi:SAM-dependent methyltransferase
MRALLTRARSRRARRHSVQAVVHRVNLADRATDQARALMADDPGDPRAQRLLLRSIEIDPTFVNAYAALADWLGSRGEDRFMGLMEVWREHGDGDDRALDFVAQYRDGDPIARLAELCERRGYGPSLIVKVGDDLGHLDLYDYEARAGEPPDLIGRVDRPRLVCSPRDFGSLPAAKQGIAEDAIKRGKDFRVVQHRGTTVQLRHRSVFGPAIDSVYYNAALHETVYRSELAGRARRVAEIGVGSGFLLSSVASSLPQRPLQLFGSDIDPRALETARRNVGFALADTSAPDDVEVRLEQDANLLEQLPSAGIDLLLTNPPYIPERRFDGDNPYSGTRVIEAFVAEQGPRVLAPGGVAVVLYSSLAAHAMAEQLARSPLVPVPLAAPRRVPLDLREVGRDAGWIELLRREHGLESTLGDPAHAYWHTLYVIALCRPEDAALVDELRTLAAANGA